MKAFTTYQTNKPTTANGYSISMTTTLYGTEAEIEFLRKSCEEFIGARLVQEYSSPSVDLFEEVTKRNELIQDLINKVKVNVGLSQKWGDKND